MHWEAPFETLATVIIKREVANTLSVESSDQQTRQEESENLEPACERTKNSVPTHLCAVWYERFTRESRQ